MILEYLDIHKHVSVCRATLYVRKQATFALFESVSLCVLMLLLLSGPEMIATKVTCYTKIEAARKQATGAKPTSANTLRLLSRLCLKLPSLYPRVPLLVIAVDEVEKVEGRVGLGVEEQEILNQAQLVEVRDLLVPQTREMKCEVFGRAPRV